MAYTGNHPLNSELLGDREVRRQLHRHAVIERKLAEELAATVVNWDAVRMHKMNKMRVMDELMRLKQRQRVH